MIGHKFDVLVHMPEFIDAQAVREYLLGLQQRIVTRFEQLDSTAFRADSWEKPPGSPLGGGGLTRIVEDGALLERGGVGFSHVVGSRLPPSATAQRPELAGRGFEAMGVSLVFHPRNPYVPTVHMNVRFFIARAPDTTPSSLGEGEGEEGEPDKVARHQTKSRSDAVWWFGGGMDLTPYYGVEDDARHFHTTCKQALEPFGSDMYPRFKQWCDEYFFLKHRNEPRGIGGIFFDDLNQPDFTRSASSAASRCNARSVTPSSTPTCRSSSAIARVPTVSANGRSRPTGVAATSSSTWCTTVARCSDCSRADAPSRS